MTNIFLEMIVNLRQNEAVLLSGKMNTISTEEEKEVAHFLLNEYKNEVIDYPFIAPEFNREAALWAAKIIYIGSNLMLYREQKEEEITAMLPPFDNEINASAMLSADLILRFLPHIIANLKLIDIEDTLIEILENHLLQWHYSAIEILKNVDEINFISVSENNCLHQLYCNRIMITKNIILAKHPLFQETIKANMGLFANEFWKELNNLTN